MQPSSLSANIPDDSYGDGLVALIKADEEKIWLIYNDQFIIYNYKNKNRNKYLILVPGNHTRFCRMVINFGWFQKKTGCYMAWCFKTNG